MNKLKNIVRGLKSGKNMARFCLIVILALFALVLFNQRDSVLAASSRKIRVIVSWVEKNDQGVELPKTLSLNTFVKDYVALNPPTFPPTTTTNPPGNATTYTLTVSADPACGTVTPSGVITVPKGSNNAFEILATCSSAGAANNVVVMMDGTTPPLQTVVTKNVPGVGLYQTFSVNNVQANHTIIVTFPSNPLPPTLVTGCAGATVYDSQNWLGDTKACLTVGNWHLADLEAKGIRGDIISSIKLEPGYEAIGYRNDVNFTTLSPNDYAGERRQIFTTSWRGFDLWDDEISSMQVVKTGSY